MMCTGGGHRPLKGQFSLVILVDQHIILSNLVSKMPVNMYNSYVFQRVFLNSTISVIYGMNSTRRLHELTDLILSNDAPMLEVIQKLQNTIKWSSFFAQLSLPWSKDKTYKDIRRQHRSQRRFANQFKVPTGIDEEEADTPPQQALSGGPLRPDVKEYKLGAIESFKVWICASVGSSQQVRNIKNL